MSSIPLTIGKSERRKDVHARVTGQARFTADIPLPGARTGMVLRSPHHHARILRIETDRSRSISGVRSVITAAEIQGINAYGALVPDQPALADRVVRHLGEPVVLIVADDPAAAERAIDAIQVEYEILPAAFSPFEALDPTAPAIHPGGNLLSHFHLETGNIATGFANADVIVEETFDVPRVAPSYLEAENSAAVYHPDGSITVWVSSQHPFEDQQHIASVLGLPPDCIRVRVAAIGGGFGGKEDSEIAILAALGAWASKGPVRIVNSRSDSFLAHPKRHPARLHYRIGARRDGALVALHAVATLDTGAYASLGPAVGSLLTELLPGPYRFPHASVETRVAYTNCPPSGAVRGFGSPQAHFAIESMVDILANRLGMDPLEVRRKNLVAPGDRLLTGVPINTTALSLPPILASVASARQRLDRIPAPGGKRAGVGFALAMQSMGIGAGVPDDSTRRLEWLPDGRVRLYLGAPDLGQGLATAAEQIAAEALGLSYESVEAVPVDTRLSPNGGITCASRMTYLVGNSVILAAERLTACLLREASPILGCTPSALAYQAGSLLRPDGMRIPVAEITARLAEAGINVSAEATFRFPYPPESTPAGLPIGMPHVLFGFGGQVVRVEVDAETGQTQVTHVVAIHDVGRMINRQAIEGQIHGGVMMAIGYALYENMPLKANGAWVDSLSEYLLPTSLDIPAEFEVQILEVPEASGPFGAKGIGEIVTAAAAPAVANALDRALGCRVTCLPILPETLLRSL